MAVAAGFISIDHQNHSLEMIFREFLLLNGECPSHNIPNRILSRTVIHEGQQSREPEMRESLSPPSGLPELRGTKSRGPRGRAKLWIVFPHGGFVRGLSGDQRQLFKAELRSGIAPNLRIDLDQLFASA
jgi:hypothetical protein